MSEYIRLKNYYASPDGLIGGNGNYVGLSVALAGSNGRPVRKHYVIPNPDLGSGELKVFEFSGYRKDPKTNEWYGVAKRERDHSTVNTVLEAFVAEPVSTIELRRLQHMYSDDKIIPSVEGGIPLDKLERCMNLLRS